MAEIIPRPRRLQSSGVAVLDNKLIEACYVMTITQKRLFDMAIATVNSMKRWKSSDWVTVSIEDYAELSRVDMHTALRACRETIGEMSKVQVVNIVYKDTNPFTRGLEDKDSVKLISHKNFFQSVEYVEDKGERLVRIQFADWLIPYIADLNATFTKLQLVHTAPLSSYYASRLYGLVILNKFKTQNESTVASRTFNIPELRQALGIIDDRYSRWCDFSKRCLAGPIEDLNAHTPFKWAFKANGRGRYLKNITITAELDEQQPLDFGDALQTLE